MRGAAMKTKDTPKQYVIYSRKSKFTGKGESIENQIELCRQYIAMHFGEEAAKKPSCPPAIWWTKSSLNCAPPAW